MQGITVSPSGQLPAELQPGSLIAMHLAPVDSDWRMGRSEARNLDLSMNVSIGVPVGQGRGGLPRPNLDILVCVLPSKDMERTDAAGLWGNAAHLARVCWNRRAIDGVGVNESNVWSWAVRYSDDSMAMYEIQDVVDLLPRTTTPTPNSKIIMIEIRTLDPSRATHLVSCFMEVARRSVSFESILDARRGSTVHDSVQALRGYVINMKCEHITTTHLTGDGDRCGGWMACGGLAVGAI